MKYAEFTIDSYKVEYFNSILGNETVLVNGIEVSNRFSIFGTSHRFNLESECFSLSSSYTAISKRLIKLELKRNAELVEKLKIDPNPNQRFNWLAVLVIVAGSYVVGLIFN